jgi:hypothetical protein
MELSQVQFLLALHHLKQKYDAEWVLKIFFENYVFPGCNALWYDEGIGTLFSCPFLRSSTVKDCFVVEILGGPLLDTFASLFLYSLRV